MGIRVSIMMDYDPTGRQGCSMAFPDKVLIKQPKEEENVPIQPQGIAFQGGQQTGAQPAQQAVPQAL